MLNLLIILLLIHYVGLFIFKPNSQVLACGIFGHCTNNPRRINQSNIKILGLFNESRGKHSCGITIDSKIFHGLEKTKLFTDFIKGKTFKPVLNPLVFGHTRSASVGAAINEHNAHPFGFGKNKNGDYKFIGVHNGTLYNQLELAEKYKIAPKATYLGITGIELERTKIDSEILLEIIHKTRSYKVLSEYIGKAALVWTDTDAPNITYFWSGKSRNSETYVAGPEMEERPMNIWIDGKNSFYFSSMPESLEAIGADTKDVFQIEYNTVYQVANGDFKNAQLTPISRKKCFQTESYSAKNYSAFNTGKETGGEEKEKEKEREDFNAYCDVPNAYQGRFNRLIPGATATLNDLHTCNIYDDKPLLDRALYKKRVYSFGLRYYQSGHRITGVFCYIPNFGFYKLGDTITEAQQAYESNKGLRFVDGDFIKNENATEGSVPFPKGPSVANYHYFLDGVFLREQLDYVALSFGDKKYTEDYIKLSHVSRHPIMDVKFTWKGTKKQEVYLNGKEYTGTMTTLGMEKTYHFVNGNLMKTVPHAHLNTKKETETVETALVVIDDNKVFNKNVMLAAAENIKKIEEKIVKEEVLDKMVEDNKRKENEDEDQNEVIDSLLIEMIDNEITPCLMSFQNCREELDLLDENNSKVKDAKSIIQTLITTISQFTILKNE